MPNARTQEEREAKLPRWVQDKLYTLRRKVIEAEDALKEERASEFTEDDVSVGVGTDTNTGHPARFYDPHTRVRFRMGKGISNYVECYIEEDYRGRRLSVRGGDMTSIHPSASNSFTVKMERYDNND